MSQIYVLFGPEVDGRDIVVTPRLDPTISETGNRDDPKNARSGRVGLRTRVFAGPLVLDGRW